MEGGGTQRGIINAIIFHKSKKKCSTGYLQTETADIAGAPPNDRLVQTSDWLYNERLKVGNLIGHWSLYYYLVVILFFKISIFKIVNRLL